MEEDELGEEDEEDDLVLIKEKAEDVQNPQASRERLDVSQEFVWFCGTF